MSKRKVSDIILEIESRVDNTLRFIQNIDFNFKNILNRLNSVEEKLNKIYDAVYQNKVTPSLNDRKTALSLNDNEEELWTPKHGQKIPNTIPSEHFKLDSEHFEAEDVEHELSAVIDNKTSRRTSRIPTQKQKSVNVTQNILLNNGRPLFLATVEIFNDNGELIKQTRTNTKGRWIAPLEPGNYRVNITKMYENKKVEARADIEVLQSKELFELQDVIIN